MLGSRRKLQATLGVRALSRTSQEGIAAGLHQAILSTCHLPPSPWVITCPLVAVQAFPLGCPKLGTASCWLPASSPVPNSSPILGGYIPNRF